MAHESKRFSHAWDIPWTAHWFRLVQRKIFRNKQQLIFLTCCWAVEENWSPQRKPLTQDNKDEERRGHRSCDVEHDSDVMSQLIHVLHIGYENRRNKKSNGNTQL